MFVNFDTVGGIGKVCLLSFALRSSPGAYGTKKTIWHHPPSDRKTILRGSWLPSGRAK